MCTQHIVTDVIFSLLAAVLINLNLNLNRCEMCDVDLDSFEDVHDKRDEVLSPFYV